MPNKTEGKSWHDYNPELRAAITANDPIAFENIVNEALSAPYVVRRDNLLIDANDYGRSFSGMNQSDMGINLIRAGIKFGNSTWFNDGVAALEVMLIGWGKGGLRIRDPEAGVSWYCGQTARNQDDQGGTLNKHLYATRTLLEIAEELREVGQLTLADKYQRAGEEGFLKIVHGKDQPMLEDYFVKKGNGDVDYKSWMYYGAAEDLGREYYIKNKEKNAHYHLFDMKLIFQIKDLVSDNFDWSEFYDKQLDGRRTALGGMLEIYENKILAGGLGVDTPSKHGLFTKTPNGEADALAPEIVDWFELWA